MLTGCAKDEYAIERRYWHISREAQKIFVNPAVTPPKELEKVVGQLNQFIQEHPKNYLAIKADFDIARLYITKEEYERARNHLKKVIQNYNKSEVICSDAVYLMGYSYETDNKWDSALLQYNKIMQDYPRTARGMDIPIYIIQYYKKKFQPDKMIGACRQAINHYNTLAEKYRGSPLAFRSHSLVAQCYLLLKEWQSAIDTLDSIIERYKNKIAMDGVLMNMAMLYSRELKDKAKAEVTLKRLIQEYPHSKLAKTAQGLLKELAKPQ
jgi:TolA-binding protein